MDEEVTRCPTCGAPISKEILIVDQEGRYIVRNGRVTRLPPDLMTVFMALYDVMPRTLARWYIAELIWDDDKWTGNGVSVLVWRLNKYLVPLGMGIDSVRAAKHGYADALYRLTMK